MRGWVEDLDRELRVADLLEEPPFTLIHNPLPILLLHINRYSFKLNSLFHILLQLFFDICKQEIDLRVQFLLPGFCILLQLIGTIRDLRHLASEFAEEVWFGIAIWFEGIVVSARESNFAFIPLHLAQ